MSYDCREKCVLRGEGNLGSTKHLLGLFWCLPQWSWSGLSLVSPMVGLFWHSGYHCRTHFSFWPLVFCCKVLDFRVPLALTRGCRDSLSIYTPCCKYSWGPLNSGCREFTPTFHLHCLSTELKSQRCKNIHSAWQDIRNVPPTMLCKAIRLVFLILALPPAYPSEGTFRTHVLSPSICSTALPRTRGISSSTSTKPDTMTCHETVWSKLARFAP